jgi:serine/threonine protein kinase
LEIASLEPSFFRCFTEKLKMAETERYQHYEVLRHVDGRLCELGRGAMGITYKAFDTNLRCLVALKVINNTYIDSDIARQRFFREVRAAAVLRHRNVASVFHPGIDHESYFYAVEFIDGETVDAYIKRTGSLRPLEALEITLQVSQALAAAAELQLVHLDLKPANLMLVGEEGEKVVKVIDFGLAKSAKREGEDAGALTIALGFFGGTPHFTSPEQLEERDIDIRSDIYSLGATLYYMISGRPPFSGSIAQIMSQHLYNSVPLEALKALPPQVRTLIQSMMEKDREKRLQTPLELRQKIVSCFQQLRGPNSLATLDLGSGPGKHLSPDVFVTPNYKLIEEPSETPKGEEGPESDGMSAMERAGAVLQSSSLKAATPSEASEARSGIAFVLAAIIIVSVAIFMAIALSWQHFAPQAARPTPTPTPSSIPTITNSSSKS